MALQAMLAFVFALPAPAAEQAEPYTPQRALETFQHDPDVRVELVACEPLVFDPVALCFDALGRLFVVENRGYPTDEKPPRGDVVLLEDKDGDGRMDTRKVFAKGFDYPNGIMAWRDGVLLTCAPDVIHLRDTDGDGDADEREVVLTGFAPGGSTQLRTSHPTLNVDGWIYFTNGLSGGEVRLPGDPPEKAVKMGTLDLRWNPWDGRIETTGGQAQFGQAFDDLGNKFVCSNRKHIQQVMLQPADLAQNPYLAATETVADIPDHDEAAKLFPISSNVTTAYSHTGTFTAACGLAIYRGTAMGESFYGNSFICDPTGNLVHRDILDADQGAARVARRAYPNREFLASPDNWFRPVFLANGPDGALYLCDMYRKTIEHPVYLPAEIAAKTDFETGRDMGRIYRIVGKDHIAKRPTDLHKMNPEELAKQLSCPNAWERDTAFRLLLEHRPEGLESTARALATGADPRAAVMGLRLLQVLGLKEGEAVARVLEHSNPDVRETVVRTFGHPWITPTKIRMLLADSSPRIRFHAALASQELFGYGDISAPPYDGPMLDTTEKELARLAVESARDPWLTAAAFLGARNNISYFLESLCEQLAIADARNDEDHLRLALRMGQAAGRLHQLWQFSRAFHAADSGAVEPWKLATFAGCLETLTTSGDAGRTKFDQLFRKNDSEERQAMSAAVLATCADAAAPINVRAHAMRLAGGMAYAEVKDMLLPLLSTGTPPEVQVLAIRALADTGDPAVGGVLAEPKTFAAFTGPARTAAKTALFSRAEWTLALLQSIERGETSPYTLDPSTRERALKSANAEVAALAKKLLTDLGGGDRDQVVEAHKGLLALPGHRDAGQLIYRNTCAQCHVFQGEGHAVGPDLSDIRAQTPDYILLHILNPNKVVTAGYESYTISTHSLETHTGIIAAQNDTAITLRQVLGVEYNIPRDDIDTLSTDNRSLMPDELERTLNDQQLRDLIAYLKGE